jgi:ATP-dependent Clp protease adaptor protein ClpS
VPNIKEATKVELDLTNPPMYKVILHNDDYTPMDFVINILMKIFHKTLDEANDITWQVHEKGKAVCGVYVQEIAQTKVHQVKSIAKANGFPLLATMELEKD